MDSGGLITLADWRRRMADLYAAVRREAAGPGAWAGWREGRDGLLGGHAQSPVPDALRAAFGGMGFFPYDASWCLVGRVEPTHGDVLNAVGAEFTPVGTVVAERGGDEIRLTLLWSSGYGGGLFLPFGDATNGAQTYGGGRYLLDQAKGADLGVASDGGLILDFNFAYHPSCAHDPQWTCPLAPAANRLPMAVRAGETAPG